MLRPLHCAFLLACGSAFSAASQKPNVLIITTDDMSCDSVGVFGCKLPDTTPNMDRLAAQSLRFNNAHSVVGNCMPSRNVMWSGRYPHNTGVEGFYQVPEAKFPVMCDLMKAAGYFKGEEQAGRDLIFKEHNENAGGQRTPMRAVQTKDYLYIFSPWSNGTRVMSGATAGTVTCKQMRVLARTDPEIGARVDLFDHRVPEEAYEVRYDPDALTNLIDDPAHAGQVATLEKAMEDWMVKTKDPMLEVFRHRDDPAFREAFMKQAEKNSAAHSKRKRSENDEGTDAPPKNERIRRETVKASGAGTIEVTFDIPAEVPGGKVSFAGLVGENINSALQHLQSKPIGVGGP